jgi:uncharacterized protein
MNRIKSKLSNYFADRSDLVAVYLFGSQAGGATHSTSDIDVALLFNSGEVPATEQIMQIEDDLTSLFKQKVDLVILNHASPVIRMQVLRKGDRVLERDHNAFIQFFIRTINEYDDLKRVRSVNEKSILRGRIYG